MFPQAAEQEIPVVAVLIDDSLSMGVRDQYPDDKEVRNAVDQLAKAASLKDPQRLQLAAALVTRTDPDWLDDLARQGKSRLVVYHLSKTGRAEKLCEIADARKAAQLKDARTKINALTPQAEASRLGLAVREVIDDFRGSQLTAVVALTDGVTTEGEDLVRVSKYAAEKGVPLFFVGIGSAREGKDLSLDDLEAPDSAEVNDTIVFRARLTGRGFPDLTVPVELREKGKEKVLAAQQVKVDPSGKPEKVKLNYRPTEEGEKVFELRVPVQEGESNVENNVVEHTIYVRKTKPIKILYVEDEPRWEFRSVKTLLERGGERPRAERAFDLKVRLLAAEEEWSKQEPSALAELPDKRQLSEFDVVILGDVDPKDKREPKMAEFLENLAEWVRRRGGGLLMAAGPRHAPHAYKKTPLADVLPIEITADRQPAAPEGGLTESYRPRLTPEGRADPIFRFGPDEKESEAVWNALHEMSWWSEGYEARRAAEVLATHPRLRRAEGKGPPVRVDRVGSDGHPLVVRQAVGNGRCLFFGFNETWRWREDDPRYTQFWTQALRSLAPRPPRVELRLDRRSAYRAGEPIRVTARFPDNAPAPDDLRANVTVERHPPPGVRGDVETTVLELLKVKGSRGTYEGLLTKTRRGTYHLTLRSPEVEGGTKPHVECVVLPERGEMDLARMNREEMEQAAKESGGRFYTLADAEQLPKDLPAAVRKP